jgi:class 3 adenylate cyclase
MSGIVGKKNFRFCLFGDTMNTAARMEQTSMAECIHVSQDVVDLAPDQPWEKLDKMHVKGNGAMPTYLMRVRALVSSSSLQQQQHPSHSKASLNRWMIPTLILATRRCDK